MRKKLIYITVLLFIAAAGILTLGKNKISFRKPSSSTQNISTPAFSERECFVSNYKTDSILVFNANARSNVSPLREIRGMNKPIGLAMDTETQELYVVNEGNNSISIYDKNAYGNLAPRRCLSGPRTMLNHPWGIAINYTDNEIYVVNRLSEAITVYSKKAQGDVSPIRTINGSDTGLSEPRSIAYDSNHKEILVANWDQWERNSVVVFDSAANGNVKPKRILLPPEVAHGVIRLHGMSFDDQQDQTLIINNKVWDPDNDESYIGVYNRIRNEDRLVPLKKIGDNQVGLDGIFIDNIYKEIFTTGSDAIVVFKKDQSINTAPSRVIRGSATGMSSPMSIVVYSK